MNSDQTILNELLSYLYGSFLVTYVLCIIGLLIKEILSITPKKDKDKKPNKISIRKLVFIPIPVTAIICAARDMYHVNFSLYVLICLAGGAGCGYIANIFINNKVVAYAIKAGAEALSDNKLLNILSGMFSQIEDEENEKESSKENEDDKDGETEPKKENDDQSTDSESPPENDDVDEEENAAKSPFNHNNSNDLDDE